MAAISTIEQKNNALEKIQEDIDVTIVRLRTAEQGVSIQEHKLKELNKELLRIQSIEING